MADAVALPGSLLAAGPVRLLSDDRLVRLASKGDRAAFATIYRRYHQDLYRYCQAILGDPQEAQDALQNTMVRALRALPGERRRIHLKPWLYRIAHNEAIDLARGRRLDAPIDADEMTRPWGPEEETETRERLRQLVADMRELPERQRGALVMRELAGMRFEEIALALDTTPAAVRQAVYEARVSLQEIAAGREMGCAAVKRALSDGDGRVLRRRDLRAHLRACGDCRDFRAGIAARRRDLAALSPLSAVASGGLLQGLLGGGGGGSAGGALAGAVGGGAGPAFAASAALKSVAVVASAVVVVSAADAGHLIRLGLLDRGGQPAPSVPTAPSHLSPASHGSLIRLGRVERRAAAEQPGLARAGRESGAGARARQKGDPGRENAAGHSTGPPAQPGSPALPSASDDGQATAAAHRPAGTPSPPAPNSHAGDHPAVPSAQPADGGSAGSRAATAPGGASEHASPQARAHNAGAPGQSR